MWMPSLFALSGLAEQILAPEKWQFIHINQRGNFALLFAGLSFISSVISIFIVGNKKLADWIICIITFILFFGYALFIPDILD